jgi:hypothetical protein
MLRYLDAIPREHLIAVAGLSIGFLAWLGRRDRIKAREDRMAASKLYLAADSIAQANDGFHEIYHEALADLVREMETLKAEVRRLQSDTPLQRLGLLHRNVG